MEEQFAERIMSVPKSFIREILKVSLDPEIISFAGGIPNKTYFPVEQIQETTQRVFTDNGPDILQYSNSEGLIGLREEIVKRYKEKDGIEVDPERILITNGSQQGLDLLGKVLVNEGDNIIIEEPGYLGAIQSLSVYRPQFSPVTLQDDGIDIDMLKSVCSGSKLMYMVPNFQNPSGVSYTNKRREEVAELAQKESFYIIEDDPYGELRFSGEPKRPVYSYAPEQTILLGSFSKTVAPGFRIGWLVAPEPVYEKLLVAKQAADLHTSSINQYILARYLQDYDLNDHLQIINDAYGKQCRCMAEVAERILPKEVECVVPEGGMFLWGKLPEGCNAMTLFDFAVKEKVVYVPGAPFYTNGGGEATFRLSFSCTEPEEIEEGMARLATAFEKYR